jgi:hypothetical protein
LPEAYTTTGADAGVAGDRADGGSTVRGDRPERAEDPGCPSVGTEQEDSGMECIGSTMSQNQGCRHIASLSSRSSGFLTIRRRMKSFARSDICSHSSPS